MISQTTINRVKRVISEIAANTKATSPGPWYMSHGHVISPGPKCKPLANGYVPQAPFDVCKVPSDNDHKIYGYNPDTYASGRNDMRHITQCEPVRMLKLTEDVQALLDEREDIAALAVRLDDIINNTMAGSDDPRAKALGDAVDAYLSSAP